MGGIGLFSTPSAGVELGFSVSHRWGLRFDLAAIRLVAAPAKRGPGDVDLDVWGGLGGACYGRKLSTTTLLEGCLVYGAGSLRGESKGYVRNGMSRRLWMVLGPKIQLNFPLSAWLSGFVGLGALGHLTRQAFSIQDVGIVANAPSAAILLQAGLRVEPLGF